MPEMPSVQVGQRDIPYVVQRSAAARERRITVEPGRVEVLALASDDEAAISGFLDRKRRWLFEAVRDVEEAATKRAVVPRFMTGSKIPYRGRMVRLTVRRTDAPHVEVSFRSGFLIDLPAWADTGSADALIATELKLWLKRRSRRDVAAVATRLEKRFGLKPRSVIISDLVGSWGSCGREGTVAINWHLIFAPAHVLDYVVAHEMAHLTHRSHGPAFWEFLRLMMPNYERAKGWLDAHQGTLGADFLHVAQ